MDDLILPFKQSCSREKVLNQHCHSRDKPEYEVWNLLKKFENKPFDDFFNKVKIFLRFQSKPMTYLLDVMRRQDIVIQNGIIINTDNDTINLPKNVIHHDNKYYFITDESKVGRRLKLKRSNPYNYPNQETYWYISDCKFSYSMQMKYTEFMHVYVISQNHHKKSAVYSKFSKVEVDYYLNPEKYDYYIYNHTMIDLTKCISFNSRKEINLFLRKRNAESKKQWRKTKREIRKEKQKITNELLGNAMIEYKLRQEKEKQIRREKEQKEKLINEAIRDRHGFDNESFKTAVSGKTYN